MGDFSLVGGKAHALEAGFVLASTQGTTITASSTVDTKGAWSELESAANNTLPSDNFKVVVVGPSSTADGFFLIDIGIGGAGSEVVIAPNLYANSVGSVGGIALGIFEFPVSIPSGERISARCQSNLSSGTIQVHIVRETPSFRQGGALGEITAIGADTSTTSGVIVARSTSGTFGSWVEMIASTADAYKGFMVSAMRDAGSWTNNGRVSYQVGVGSVGNEEAIYSGHMMMQNANEIMCGSASPFVAVAIASGQRIAIRAVGSASNTDLDFDYILYGAR